MLAVYRRFGTTVRPAYKDCLTFGDMVDGLSRNVGTELLFYAACNPELAQISRVLFTVQCWLQELLKAALFRRIVSRPADLQIPPVVKHWRNL